MKRQAIENIEKFRSNLHQGNLEGNTLYDLVYQYSADKGLINKALVYQLNLKSLPPGLDQTVLIEKIDHLLEGVKAGLDNLPEQQQARQRRAEKIQRLLQDRQPKRHVMVKVDNIEKTLGGKNGFHLGPISAEFRLGEITGLVGANANGKTTLIRILAGLLGHDRGTLEYPHFTSNQLRSPSWGKIKHRIAYVPQELQPRQGTLLQHLHYEAAIHGIRGEDNETAVNYIIHRLGLQAYTHLDWKVLSGGYKLRFALANALVWNPSLLIIDEPLANLDVAAQIVILKDLYDLAHSYRNPICIIISSQHLHEVESVADNIMLLDRGSVAYSGPRKDFAAQRLHNTFEFSSPLQPGELRRKLGEFTYQRLDWNGFFYVLRCTRETDVEQFLRYCLQHSIPLEHFRNISTSVKQRFV